MSLLLSIDTAGSVCAVALSTQEELISVRILDEPRSHSGKLVPLIRDILADAGHNRGDLAAIAVSKGPGSYTGLRIGVSTAKGLAFGLDIPIVGVATFEAMAWANRDLPENLAPRPANLITVAPSRRNEAYWQLWQMDDDQPDALSGPRSDSYADIVNVLLKFEPPAILVGETPDSLLSELDEAGIDVVTVGPDEQRATIHGVSAIGLRRLVEGMIEDVALFEPFYLKEFVARKGGSPFERLPF